MEKKTTKHRKHVEAHIDMIKELPQQIRAEMSKIQSKETVSKLPEKYILQRQKHERNINFTSAQQHLKLREHGKMYFKLWE